MKNLTARFTSADSTLRVTARTGAKGITVLVRVKAAGAPGQTGCRNVFLLTHEADAVAKFEELRAAAIAKGWTEKVKAERNVVAFTVIPTPTEVAKPKEAQKVAPKRKVA
jgi:hypothetical protein